MNYRTVLLWEVPCSRSKQGAYPEVHLGENCAVPIKRPLCALVGRSECPG